MQKAKLRSLVGKKLTFAYLYHKNFISIQDEDLEKIDVINYSFGSIINGILSINHLLNLEKIVSYAHIHGVRVVLSIGGWGAEGYSEASKSLENRTVLINSIIEVIKNYHLDGVDLDWEYPTTSEAKILSSPDDKDNLSFLIKELKKAMLELDSNLILSIAVSGSQYAAKHNYDIKAINEDLDYIHVMTYDMLDYSNGLSMHHTNLYKSENATSSVDTAINAYINEGADINKLIIGIAFYGHIGTILLNSKNGINAKCECLNNTISFTDINNNYLFNPIYNQYYDEEAKATWLFNGTTFITYDDPASVRSKCDYVKRKSLGGVMFWEYNHDKTKTLLDVIFNNLNK